VGCDAALLSLADLKHETIPQLLEHARAIASVVSIIGFYLQPAVGGRLLSYEFWRQFVEIETSSRLRWHRFTAIKHSMSFAPLPGQAAPRKSPCTPETTTTF
jgi:hypothetical protein